MEVGAPALIEIIGVDGSEWTVSGPGAGQEGVELDLEPQGLIDEAPIKGIWQQSAFQHGATYLGHSIEPIDMVLPFSIVGDGDDWEYIESRFHAAWSEDKLTLIRVTTGDRRRTLSVVKFEHIKTTTESGRDPHLLQWSDITITARAGWPFWEGDTIVSEATTTASSTDLTLTIANPTDTWMWPKWAMTAPGKWRIPDGDWGEGDMPNRAVWTPTLRSGQELTIDTNPLNEPYVAADGSNIAGRFNGVLFLHPIPPRTPPTDLTVRVEGASGTSAVQCRQVHYWKRPWGGDH